MLQEEIEESRAALRAGLGPTESGRSPSGALPQQHDPEGSAHDHTQHQEDGRLPGAEGQLSPTGSHPLGRHPSAISGLDAGSRPRSNQQASLHRPVAMRLAPPDLMAQLSQQLPVPSGAEQAVRHAQPDRNAQLERNLEPAVRHAGPERALEQAMHEAPQQQQQQQRHLQHEVTLRGWEPQAAGLEAVEGHKSAQPGTEHTATAPGLHDHKALVVHVCL